MPDSQAYTLNLFTISCCVIPQFQTYQTKGKQMRKNYKTDTEKKTELKEKKKRISLDINSRANEG